jgi:uncharacterized membrane-anchored protein YitT (DUF2179 family)
MKLVFLSIGSWLAGTGILLLGLSFVSHGAFTLGGAGIAPLITTALIFSLAYGPSLTWLKRRLGAERTSIFPLTSSLVLNLPVFLISLLAIGRTLLPAEAYAVMISFAVMGATFGRGFIWNSQRQERIKESHHQLPMIVSKQAFVSRVS